MLESVGTWLASAYALYGMFFLLLAVFTYADVLLLGAVIWTAVRHARGRDPWPFLPASVRRWGRLAVEVSFGLVNPLIYLVVLSPSLPPLQFGAWWFEPLTSLAWVLLVGFWSLRIFGVLLEPRSRLVRAGVRALLVASLGCLLAYAIKDASLVLVPVSDGPPFPVVLRLAPLYLVPAVLLCDYILSASRLARDGRERHGLFVLSDRAARVAVAGVVVFGLVTLGMGAYRRSDANVRALVNRHRDAIQSAAARYDVDPRLIASIVYVTHRDQLSPFRNALERIAMSVWSKGFWPGINANDTLLNRPLDISVGLAQIKPRTAQTASLLAAGLEVADLPGDAMPAYRDAEPAGEAWIQTSTARISAKPPFPVPADRQIIGGALLDTPSNLATCALILALYQKQWETANVDWSLRGRPEILATLYQIGFARSKPHGAPRSNAFGDRVRQVYDEPWLGQLFPTPRPPGKPASDDAAS